MEPSLRAKLSHTLRAIINIKPMGHLYCLVFLAGGLLIQCKANEQAGGSSKAPANISFTKHPLIPTLLYYF